MSKSDAFENDLLKLVFNGTPIVNLADNAAVAPLVNLYIALHTADPGEAGNQATSETAYLGYTRIPLIRSTGGWTVTGGTVVNLLKVTFAQCLAGSPTSVLTHCSIGAALSGTGKILYSGPLTTPLTVSPSISPEFAPGTLSASED